MLLETALIYKWFFIIVNRIASWFGSGYFFKKGVKQKKWHYFAIAIVVSIIMFVIMALVLSHYFHKSK